MRDVEWVITGGRELYHTLLGVSDLFAQREELGELVAHDEI